MPIGHGMKSYHYKLVVTPAAAISGSHTTHGILRNENNSFLFNKDIEIYGVGVTARHLPVDNPDVMPHITVMLADTAISDPGNITNTILESTTDKDRPNLFYFHTFGNMPENDYKPFSSDLALEWFNNFFYAVTVDNLDAVSTYTKDIHIHFTFYYALKPRA